MLFRGLFYLSHPPFIRNSKYRLPSSFLRILFLLVNMGKPFSGTVHCIADPGSLSRISDPESWIQQQHQKRRGKWSFPIFCSHKDHKIVNVIVNTKNYSTFYPKICHLAIQNIWDPGSEIHGQKRHRIPDPWIRNTVQETSSFSPLAHPEYCMRKPACTFEWVATLSAEIWLNNRGGGAP